jgi:hypothetical protein
VAPVIGPAAKLTLGEQLVRRPGGHGFVDARVLEDRADGAYERVGVEHGPMCPDHRGGQQDQKAGQGDQDADDRPTESPLPGGFQFLDLLGQRVPLCLEAPDLLGGVGIFGRLVLGTGMGVAHRYPTLRQVAAAWWNAVPRHS